MSRYGPYSGMIQQRPQAEQQMSGEDENLGSHYRDGNADANVVRRLLALSRQQVANLQAQINTLKQQLGTK